jgi:hypothetical protein
MILQGNGLKLSTEVASRVIVIEELYSYVAYEHHLSTVDYYASVHNR